MFANFNLLNLINVGIYRIEGSFCSSFRKLLEKLKNSMCRVGTI